tara:strand:+ start:94 stop:648 length:555 start_codon:yes stop_codon:yes gene_type:complete
MNKYQKRLYAELPTEFSFKRLPVMSMKLLKTDSKCWVIRIIQMAKPRTYVLEKDWTFSVKNYRLESNQQLTRDKFTILLPKHFVFDGASIPFPWLLACLSFGILRPMGILLTASIIHDFSFRYGYLKTVSDNEEVVRTITRSEADRLFRDIVNVVNDAPIAAYVAWLGVRLGALLGIKYGVSPK